MCYQLTTESPSVANGRGIAIGEKGFGTRKARNLPSGNNISQIDGDCVVKWGIWRNNAGFVHPWNAYIAADTLSIKKRNPADTCCVYNIGIGTG